MLQAPLGRPPGGVPNNIRRAERKNLTASEAWGAPPRVAPRSAVPARPRGPRRGSGVVVCDEGRSAPGRAGAAVVPARLLLLLLGFRVLNYIHQSILCVWSLAGIICVGNMDECHSLLRSSYWGNPYKGV